MTKYKSVTFRSTVNELSKGNIGLNVLNYVSDCTSYCIKILTW